MTYTKSSSKHKLQVTLDSVGFTRIEERSVRVQGVMALVNIIPEENQIVLKYICNFLSRVSDFSSKNMMTKANLGVCTEFAESYWL